MTIDIGTTDGGTVQVSPELLQAFRNGFCGAVIGPEDPDYSKLRKIWNAMIDRHPAVIMRCTSTADVMQAVRECALRPTNRPASAGNVLHP